MTEIRQPLTLAAALTRRAEQLCIELEQGVADIYDK
jgi:type III restriction enzyme